MALRRTLKLYGPTALAGIIGARFSRLLSSPCHLNDPDGSPKGSHWLGAYGEKVAATWLKSHGIKILARNFRGPRMGEVDIVARDKKLLLFIEVKTRRSNSRIRPYDAVNKHKQALIERGANAWLKELRTRDLPWRFDIIEVHVDDGHTPVVNHIKDAF